MNMARKETVQEAIQKQLNDPRTQSKAVVILQKLNELKNDDYEAAAIAIMIHRAIDLILEGAHDDGR
jgi:hypothetical protein